MSRHRPTVAGRRTLPSRPSAIAQRRRLPWRSAAPARVAAVPTAPEPAEEYAELCERARAELEAGHPQTAMEEAQRALRVLPRGLEAQKLLGMALLEVGEARAAQGVFQAALACDPVDVVVLVGLAEAQERLTGAAEAAPAWLRAHEAEPGLPQVEQRLLAAQRAALPPLPNNGAAEALRPAVTRAALSRIYLRGGLHEHAAAEARAVLAHEPERLDAQLTLAEAFWRGGDRESAAAVAATILDKLPDCTAANLLFAAQLQAVGTDPAALLARIRAVDPGGAIAGRLFDDREPPPLFGDRPVGPQWSITRPTGPFESPPATAKPAAAPAIAEPEALVREEAEAPVSAATKVEAPAETEERAPAAETEETERVAAEPVASPPEPEAVADRAPEAEEPELLQPTITAEELAALWPPPAVEPQAAEAPGTTYEPEPAPSAPEPALEEEPAAAAAEPAAEPERVMGAASVPTPTPADGGELEAADRAMAAGHYLNAARAYGAVLRALRAARAPEAER